MADSAPRKEVLRTFRLQACSLSTYQRSIDGDSDNENSSRWDEDNVNVRGPTTRACKKGVSSQCELWKFDEFGRVAHVARGPVTVIGSRWLNFCY